jgi:ribosomal protein L11 methyltransferase
LVELRLRADEEEDEGGNTFLVTTSGSLHTTTRSIVEWLSDQATTRPAKGQERLLLDYGCGSGILGLAALKLGTATDALLTDISAPAVACALGNARLNRLAERCECVANLPSVRTPTPVADLVVANMLAGPLCAVALDLAARTRGCRTVRRRQ